MLVKFFLMVAMLFPFAVYSDFKKINVDTQVMIKEAVAIASDTYGIKPRLIMSVIYVESRFKPKARNGSSVGLMQVHTRFHKHKFGGKDYYDIYANVFVGTSILKDCLVKHKNQTKKALKCYNGGGDKNYVAKVMKAFKLNPLTI
jgi:soluble lytic murein transglycosylase-like protein